MDATEKTLSVLDALDGARSEEHEEPALSGLTHMRTRGTVDGWSDQ
jgi:hypothetical protein